MDPNEAIPIFEKEREAIGYFNRELAVDAGGYRPERRRFPRIKTALAAEVEFKSHGDSFYFEVVVTNLSEGGLYAEFLDSRAEELARRTLDPFDLKLLTVEIWLPNEERVLAEGKVLRSETEASKATGVALEFYEVGEEDKTKLKRFLEEQK
jgi:c-di-GMP-binding flagellar brake protein YcgR